MNKFLVTIFLFFIIPVLNGQIDTRMEKTYSTLSLTNDTSINNNVIIMSSSKSYVGDSLPQNKTKNETKNVNSVIYQPINSSTDKNSNKYTKNK